MRSKAPSMEARSSLGSGDADGPGSPAVEAPMQRGSRSLLRDINVSLLIELVRRSGPISRAELARQSGLSAANGLHDRGPAARAWNLHRGRNGTLERRSPARASQCGPESRLCDRDQAAWRRSDDGGLRSRRPSHSDRGGIGFAGRRSSGRYQAIEQETRRALRAAAVPRSRSSAWGSACPGSSTPVEACASSPTCSSGATRISHNPSGAVCDCPSGSTTT